jgi:hypothetical protein
MDETEKGAVELVTAGENAANVLELKTWKVWSKEIICIVIKRRNRASYYMLFRFSYLVH